MDVQPRDLKLKAKQLLESDLIPLEYYGKGVENKSFQVDYQTFRRIFNRAGSNTIISLKDGKGNYEVLVHDVQYHPITDKIVHVDFINVEKGKVIHTKVPIEFTGNAPAVKELAGTLMTSLTEVEIKCLPKDLIHSIEVNIDSLVDFTVFIRVKDLIVPSTIEILNDPEDVVVTVVPPAKEEEPEPAAEGTEGAEAAEGEEGEKAEGEEEKAGEKGEAKEE